MRTLITGIAMAAAIAFAPQAAFAQKAEDAVGTWRHPENGSHIKMYMCGANLCAKIVKITDGQKVDDKNPNPARRNRPIIGLHIMTAKKTGANTWAGSLYKRDNGQTYSGTVTVTSKNALSLQGCAGGILCQSVTWSRVN